MNIQDAINVLAEQSDGFRNTEIRVVTKGGGSRPIANMVLRNGHLFLVPDFDADKDAVAVIDEGQQND